MRVSCSENIQQRQSNSKEEEKTSKIFFQQIQLRIYSSQRLTHQSSGLEKPCFLSSCGLLVTFKVMTGEFNTQHGFAYIDVHGSVANRSLGQIFITSIQIILIIFLFFVFIFQKRITSICRKKYTMAICFQKLKIKKIKIKIKNKTNLN